MTVTWSARFSSRVEKVPGVLRVTLAAKMISARSGRPRFVLRASNCSKTVRTRRGSSKTRVRETSICRLDRSHQQPCCRSAPVSGSGSRLIQYSKNARSVSAWTMSHSSCSRTGSEVAANPLASGVTVMPSASAARRAISWPLTHAFAGYGAYAHTLMNAHPAVMDIE